MKLFNHVAKMRQPGVSHCFVVTCQTWRPHPSRWWQSLLRQKKKEKNNTGKGIETSLCPRKANKTWSDDALRTFPPSAARGSALQMVRFYLLDPHVMWLRMCLHFSVSARVFCVAPLFAFQALKTHLDEKKNNVALSKQNIISLLDVSVSFADPVIGVMIPAGSANVSPPTALCSSSITFPLEAFPWFT